MVRRRLGSTDLELSPIGFGAFKIGRNEGIKYTQGYELPDDDAVAALLDGIVEAGIGYVDTAPAYGLSETRVGRVLGPRTDVVISTKTGETFEDGRSTHDFSAAATLASVQRSRSRLGREVLDLVFVHSDGDDDIVLADGVVPTLHDLRERGVIRAIGFSGKTVSGAETALAWADAIMVEYHLDDRSHEGVIVSAAEAGVGVIVKKALAAGRLDPGVALRFVLSNPGVTSVVVGSLDIGHLKANVAVAEDVLGE